MSCSIASAAHSTARAAVSGRKQLEVLYAVMLDLQQFEGCELVTFEAILNCLCFVIA